MTLSRMVAVRTTPAISRTTARSMMISPVLRFISSNLETEQHLTLLQPMTSRDSRLDRRQCQSTSCSARDRVNRLPREHQFLHPWRRPAEDVAIDGVRTGSSHRESLCGDAFRLDGRQY